MTTTAPVRPPAGFVATPRAGAPAAAPGARAPAVDVRDFSFA
jgi:hypothetical protein